MHLIIKTSASQAGFNERPTRRDVDRHGHAATVLGAAYDLDHARDVIANYIQDTPLQNGDAFSVAELTDLTATISVTVEEDE